MVSPNFICQWQHQLSLSQLMRLWYLSHRRPVTAQASLRIRSALAFEECVYGGRKVPWSHGLTQLHLLSTSSVSCLHDCGLPHASSFLILSNCVKHSIDQAMCNPFCDIFHQAMCDPFSDILTRQCVITLVTSLIKQCVITLATSWPGNV